MPSLIFAERSGVNAPQLASEIQAALSLSTLPSFSQLDKNFVITHPDISEANRSAIQTVINNHVANPLFGVDLANLKPTNVTINGAATLTWTNMPAALTSIAATEGKLPLFGASVGRLCVRVNTAGAAGAVLVAQFSLDGSNYVNGPQVPINSTGLKVSALASIPDQYQADVFFRMAGQGGNGTADPAFGLITLQVA